MPRITWHSTRVSGPAEHAKRVYARLEKVRFARGAAPGSAPLDLHLYEGGFYFLVGDDDAAKRSLLKVLTLQERPASGVVHLLGDRTDRLGPARIAGFRRRFGVVQDDLPLLGHLTLFDNVALPLRIAGLEDSDLATPVAEMIDWIGLGHRAVSRADMLTREESRLGELARACISRPEILVIDGLFDDPSVRLPNRLVYLVDRINKLGAMVVVSTGMDAVFSMVPHGQFIRLDRTVPSMFGWLTGRA